MCSVTVKPIRNIFRKSPYAETRANLKERGLVLVREEPLELLKPALILDACHRLSSTVHRNI